MTAPVPLDAPAAGPSTVLPLPWRIGAAVGRLAVTAGALLLCFAGYQVWGTGFREASAQDELTTRLAEALEARPAADHDPLVPRAGELDPGPGPLRITPDDAAVVGPGILEVAAPTPAEIEDPVAIGDPVASIRIEAIGLDKTVVEGTNREALRSGPGHYVGTARPGHPGNVGIAGHRTTYGAPFREIDRLQPGDAIVVETIEGVFTYRVEAQTAEDGTVSGHRIVSPEDVEVIADRGDNRLTLTACHPLYSARQRIVVTAVLAGDPLGTPPTPPAEAGPMTPPAPAPVASIETAELVALPIPMPHPAPTADPPTAAVVATRLAASDDDLGWQSDQAAPTARWALATAGIALAAWVLGRLWRRWPAYAVAGPAFALALLTCFAHLDRLLPAA